MEKKYVQSFERGLDVLAALNIYDGASVNELATATGIHRAIVYRLVETLRRKGYVRKDEHLSKYWLISTVQSLSEGFKDNGWINDVVSPGLRELGAKVLWPVSVSTCSGGSMVVRACSDYQIAFTLSKIPVGFRLPITRTAAGRIYLSFCRGTEREIVFRSAGGERVAPEYSARLEPASLEEIYQRGYEIQEAMIAGFRKVASIAVPILSNAGVLGALALRFFPGAMSGEEAAQKYLADLTLCASGMAREYPQHGSAGNMIQ